MASPLKQFEIKSIAPMEVGGIDVSFTNSSLFMVIAITAITAFLVLGMRKRALVPGRWQSLAELSYEFVAGLVRDNVGHQGRAYFPFIFSLFMFILFANTIGLIPYAFTVTSHIIVTFALAAVVFAGVTVVAIVKHRMKFFTYFLPKGTPLYMAPLLIPIEMLSYLARPVTLSLRLFANMMAGHTMLKVFAGFVITLGLAGVFPMAVLVALYLLELIVAVLQAFVFTILTCLYLHDAIHLH
ncbi:MAG: F0F1 ATP synthase subunit A [Alphaproteobacteria bacterium]|nr:F0F1 ATP synthase subunit A [Pseudomonadota bacterium]TDI68345.1 MAG: F0F1 ATP synthase subunit A [Alphaproteobacteria bacterium]